MDKYTILDHADAATALAVACDGESPAVAARRDLEAALQLLAERAQYLTGASGAAIALRDGGEMVCRASSGSAAPEVGVEIETDSALTAESIRTRRLVRFNPAKVDSRIKRENSHELGVKSAMVMPLLREHEVAGVFEVVSDRESAFEEHDVATLMRLADLALTAVDHADAAQRTLPEISEAERDQVVPEKELAARDAAESIQVDQELPSTAAEAPASGSAEITQIGRCEACGFPVSQGRTLCVDCEQAGRSTEDKSTGGAAAFSALTAMGREESWVQAHSYTIGTLVIAVLTIVLLALKLH
jgi:putative methionine-R-sulfoxide reductase with GAF domain